MMKICIGNMSYNNFGNITAISCDKSIIRLLFENDNKQRAIERIKMRYPDYILQDSESEILRQCFNELSQYFSGKLSRFSVPVLTTGTEFEQKIWAALLKQPYGQTISYSQLAVKAGYSASASRAAGNAAGKNPIPVIIPCHRVIRNDGGLGGFSGGIGNKIKLLQIEGCTRWQIQA